MTWSLLIHGVAKSLYGVIIQMLLLPYRLAQFSPSTTYDDTHPFLRSATALLGLSSRDFFASATASVESQFTGEEHLCYEKQWTSSLRVHLKKIHYYVSFLSLHTSHYLIKLNSDKCYGQSLHSATELHKRQSRTFLINSINLFPRHYSVATLLPQPYSVPNKKRKKKKHTSGLKTLTTQSL